MTNAEHSGSLAAPVEGAGGACYIRPHLRGLLYEAATVILTRAGADSSLRSWGLKLREKVGFKRAAVAVARKFSVIMHAMLKSGEFFDRSAGMVA